MKGGKVKYGCVAQEGSAAGEGKAGEKTFDSSREVVALICRFDPGRVRMVCRWLAGWPPAFKKIPAFF